MPTGSVWDSLFCHQNLQLLISFLAILGVHRGPHYDINVHFSDLSWDWQRFSYVYWTLIICFVRLWRWLPGGYCCCCFYFLKYNDPLLIFKSLHTLYLSLLSVIWTVNIISHPIACIDISLMMSQWTEFLKQMYPVC